MVSYNPSTHTHEFFNELKNKFNGNRSRMAYYLGISRSTLYNWIERTKQNPISVISFENLKDYLERTPNVDRNKYLLNEMTKEKKPLQNNARHIVKAIRNLLKEHGY